MKIETIIDAHATIGESPTWVQEERALYWIDVKAPALHRYTPDDGAVRCWPLTSDVGGFALLADGGMLVALRNGIHRLDLETAELRLLATPPFDPALFRFNEGACDSSGRFWVGVMFDPLEGSHPPQVGKLHSFTLSDGLRPEPDAAELHNGMSWSADERTFFLSHSNTGEIFAFDYVVDTGRLSRRRLYAAIRRDEGIPDGAAIDAEGAYWCALHGGSKLRRFRVDGSIDIDIDLPVSQPTMCAFGGEALRDLYVTSACDKMDPKSREKEPLAGALLRFRPKVAGMTRHCLAR